MLGHILQSEALQYLLVAIHLLVLAIRQEPEFCVLVQEIRNLYPNYFL